MKKYLFAFLCLAFLSLDGFCAGVFEGNSDTPVEIKLAPTVSTPSASPAVSNSNDTTQPLKTIKELKFSTALTNLDDAQVELRQELSTITAKYNTALAEKEKSIQNCKNLKKEIKAINQKMRNIDKSKKMINKNLET